MHEFFIIIYIFICIALIGLILIQHGKGADAGAAFGSGASATVFGSQGSASFLTRVTAGLATGFFVISLILTYFSGKPIEKRSVVNNPVPAVTSEAPKTPNNSETPVLPPVMGTPTTQKNTSTPNS